MKLLIIANRLWKIVKIVEEKSVNPEWFDRYSILANKSQ